MSRRSPLVIGPSDDERAALDVREQECAPPHREAVRAKIFLLATAGLGNDDIAARVGFQGQIVSE
jgi:hypothetical protein